MATTSRLRGLVRAAFLLGALSAALPSLAQDGKDALVAQGKAVAIAGDCAACHTSAPSRPFAGGRAIGSPMGNIYASNITPSRVDGIGGYSEAQFARAVREGVNAKGDHLYPAMPYTAYAGITDADMHALYVYFMQGVAPVDNAVPKTALAFPYSMRWTMAGWNLMFLHKPSANQDGAERGRYLVDVLGHCSSCHSPRNLLMAERQDAYLGGATIDGWFAPNITSDPVSGIGGWSEDELAAYLKNGHVHGKGQAGGGMAEAVEQSLRFLSDDDVHAMAAYLKTVRPIRDGADTRPSYAFAGAGALPSTTTLEPLRPDADAGRDARRIADGTDGSVLYSGACASCHQPDGKGTREQYFPSLSHNRAVGLSRPDNVIMAVLHGIDRQGADMHVSMPAFERDMSDAQVAAVVN
ncbi:MAG: cytochrome c, partial [Luteibacter sp.]